MLSEKPWKPEAVLRLGGALLISLCLGVLVGQVVVLLLPREARGDQTFVNFMIGSASFQGATLVLMPYFLRQHHLGWREFLGLPAPRFGRALVLAVATALVVVPLALLLLSVFASLMNRFHWQPVDQAAIKVLQTSVGPGQRVCFGIVTILLAPAAEESFFRGVLYPAIKQYGHPILALLASSMFFALIHFNAVIFVPMVLFAGVLVLLYEKTNTLIAPILAHAVFNAVNFFLSIYEAEMTDWFHRLCERI